MFIINMRKFCSVLQLWHRRSHVINIILRSMIKGWWYRYQSRQTNTAVYVMFFQYYICKFPLFSTKYMINWYIEKFEDIFQYVNNLQSEPALGSAGLNVIPCETCSGLLCVLEQPRVNNSSTRPLKRGVQLGAIGQTGLRPVL